jgi:periplasmic protein TonB
MVEPLIPVLEPKETSTPAVISRASAIRGTGRQFTHFGVMDTGRQNSGALATSLIGNLVLAALFILISASVTKTLEEHRRLVTLTLPVEQPKPPEPVKPPKPLPKPPVLKAEPPKIVTEKLPDIPKPVVQPVVMPHTTPVLTPPPPKAITAPAAPQPVNLGRPQAASLPNNSTNPSPVALGRPDSPIPTNTNKPTVSSVDLGQKGLPGMTASNTGAGPASTKVNLGSGQPDSQSLKGNGTQKVLGVRLGQAGGTGPPNGTGQQIGQVSLGQVQQPTAPKSTAAQPSGAAHPPKVLYKPQPAYTAEARAQHISGAVTIKIRVSATGGVTVLEVVNGLGHGLDESARNAIMATKFAPATDGNGHAVDWEGMVRVDFELSNS